MSLDSTVGSGLVRLVSSKDKTAVHEIKKEYAMISTFLKTTLEQDPNASELEVDVTAPVLDAIVRFMNYHKGTEPALIDKPLRSRNMVEVCPDPFDADFIDKIHFQSQQLLYDLLMGALYLHIPSLLHLGCAKVASLIKGHPLDKVKHILVPGANVPT